MSQVSPQEAVLTVLELVNRNVKFCGLESTLEALRKLDESNNNELKEKILNHSIRLCANTYGIDAEKIKNSSERGEVKEARCIVWHLLKNCVDMSNSEIARIWDVSKQSVGQGLAKIKLDQSSYTKKDLEIKEKYDRIKKQVIVYKNNILEHAV